MPRFLLATEGPVDDVVLGALCATWCGLAAADIDRKVFPARGIEQVLRLVPEVVRAAHFGHYDALLIHADADETPEHVMGHQEPRCRVCMLQALVRHTVKDRVFGGTRFGHVTRAEELVPHLLARWSAKGSVPPPSLDALHLLLTQLQLRG
ncbi:hypothetical protein [Chondromyces apiculatus]|uniref:Uncharacterized protein n=1 Tax=Chondromyces apiculatus DSM 436 TaxID=1192034 RepID=A0A017TFR5_9BACT|nr:hypothetical protein [Chondromyces apiculatus]EYF07665.1 Hypothetical protein CAP_8166 [Chondromyces apiculatus DSM 436]